MAAITQNSRSGPNWKNPTAQTLTTSDTLTYVPGSGQELFLINKSGGALTPTITGSAATAQPAPQGGTVNYATGTSPGSLAVGAAAYVRLDDIPGFLAGTITITGGSGLTALLMGP